jgi:CRP/FNR family transcriptional regulator, cyclic AMP receptor protein
MRNQDSVADALARTARYANCPRRELDLISRAGTRIDVPAGTVLATEGGRGLDFAIVLSGTATVTTGTTEVGSLHPGNHFGDISLIDRGPSEAGIVAATPMALAVYGPAEFGMLLQRSPAVAHAVLSGLAHRVRTAA